MCGSKGNFSYVSETPVSEKKKKKKKSLGGGDEAETVVETGSSIKSSLNGLFFHVKILRLV